MELDCREETNKIKIMKLIMTFAVLCLTTAVFAQQNRSMRAHVAERSTSSLKSPVKHQRVKGIVRIDDVCGLHIEVQTRDGVKNFFPVNMPEDFKVDGKSIFFDGADTVAEFKEGCDMIGAISVSNVQARRKAVRQ